LVDGDSIELATKTNTLHDERKGWERGGRGGGKREREAAQKNKSEQVTAVVLL
jgi:hypothetical protein